MSVCVCGDVSLCEDLKLVSSSVSATATVFESVIPAGSAGGNVSVSGQVFFRCLGEGL